MSKHEDSFQIPLLPDEAKALCGRAIVSLGLAINADVGHGFVCAESLEFGFTWPVTMNVLIDRGDMGMSRITIGGSNFGFGPIQSSHVKGKVNALRQRIEMMVHQPLTGAPAPQQRQPQAAPPPSRATEVFVNGFRIRDDQVTMLEQKFKARLPNGSYWYDRMSGGWGKMGGPLLCMLEPNLNVGGQLQPGASAGNTGIFINGRELHYLESALLQRAVPMIIPGRWWLDVYGNFGGEGGPMLGNIWELAKRHSEDRTSVLSSWDRKRAAGFGV